MNPNLENEDRLIVTKIPYYFHEPERFDVIVFKSKDGRDFIKRVIGLPGDTIRYEDDQLYVNDIPVDEPYLDEVLSQKEGNYTVDFTLRSKTINSSVPEGNVFVLGDNRPNSVDSRVFGFVPIDTIKGVALTRFAPFDKLAWNVSDVTIYAETE